MESALEEKIGYSFADKGLLTLAFTHSSYHNEHPDESTGYNERLEFLGDTVLNLIVSSYLYKELPAADEGALSKMRAQIVSSQACAVYLDKLSVVSFLKVGHGEAQSGGKRKESVIADLFEAVIGALYLDGGLEAAQAFFFSHFSDEIAAHIAQPLRNWKADLQEYTQEKFQQTPRYEVIEELGLPHEKEFYVAVLIGGEEIIGKGKGSSKKEAEVAAAKQALESYSQ